MSSLKVKSISFEHYKDACTYNCIVTFLNKGKVRLVCQEDPKTQNMYPKSIEIMEGKCPCCQKPSCDSIQNQKNMLFKQILDINPKAIKF